MSIQHDLGAMVVQDTPQGVVLRVVRVPTRTPPGRMPDRNRAPSIARLQIGLQPFDLVAVTRSEFATDAMTLAIENDDVPAFNVIAVVIAVERPVSVTPVLVISGRPGLLEFVISHGGEGAMLVTTPDGS